MISAIRSLLQNCFVLYSALRINVDVTIFAEV